MSIFSIYFSDDSELAEYEATSRGYRLDVYVEIDNDLFNVNVYAMLRLQQDFESEIKSYGFYLVDPNLIIVSETDKQAILFAISKLYTQEYFQALKPVKDIDISQLVKVQ